MMEMVPYLVAAFPGVVGILVFLWTLAFLGVEDQQWRKSQ